MRSTPLLTTALLGFVLAGCSSGGSLGSQVPMGSPPTRPAGGSASQYLSNVVVIIQENRTIENFFAGYPGANAPMTGCASPSPKDGISPRVPAPRPLRRGTSSSCPPGDTQVTLHQDTFKNNPDLRHDWDSSMVDWNNGQMDGFSHWGMKNGQYEAYTYIDHAEIQPYLTMAGQYVLADEMFPTEFGGSFTAHLTLVAGTDDIKLPGEAEVDFPNHTPDDCDSPTGTKSSYITNKPYRKMHRYKGPFPCFNQFNSMAEVLDNAGVSWKYYASKFLDAGFWEPFEAIQYVRYGSDWNPNIIVAPQTKVLTDAQNGTLAKVSWVTPPNSTRPGPSSMKSARRSALSSRRTISIVAPVPGLNTQSKGRPVGSVSKLPLNNNPALLICSGGRNCSHV